MKRMADILIAGSGLVLLSPILVMLALLIQVLDPPAFVLVQGRLKFQPWPLLRRFSIDELPVLVQVLLGEHSLFDPKIRQMFWPERPEPKPDPDFRRVLVVLVILAALYLFYLNLCVI